MRKYILLIIIFLSQGIMSWGQSDTLAYESIVGYYENITKKIESYQSSGNINKASELEKERDEYINALGDSYGKALFFLALSRGDAHAGDFQSAIIRCSKAVEIFKKILGREHVYYALSLNELSNYYAKRGNYSKAILLETESLEICKKVLGIENPDYVTSLANLAAYNAKMGNYTEAIRLETESLKICKKVLGTEHPHYVASLNNLTLYNSYICNYTEAIRLGTEAVEILKKNLGTEHPDYAASIANLALYNSYICNYSEAIRLGTEAVEILKKNLGTEHPDYAASIGNLAKYNSCIGNCSEAIRLGIEAMEIRKKVLGTEHPDYATSLGNLANYYADLGNYAEAIRLGEDTKDIMKKFLGTEHPSYATSLSNLASYYSKLGDNAEAIRLGMEAMEIRKKVLGTEHPDYATSLANLAGYYADLGNYAEAIRLDAEAMVIIKKVLGKEHPDYSVFLSKLAFYNASRGNYSEALWWENEAMIIRKRVLGMEHPAYAVSLANLALYNFYIGDYSEAIRIGTEAMEIRKKVLGSEHPKYATSLEELSSYNFFQTKYNEAWIYLKQLLDVSQSYIVSSFSNLSSGLQKSLWSNRFVYSFNTFLPSLVYRLQTKESVSELYDKTSLFAKAILLNSSVGMRELILESGDTTLIARYNAIVINKGVYEKLLEKPIKERFLNTDSLHSVIQRQEMELVRDSKAYGDFARNLRIKWKDVQQHLDDTDIAVEFLDFPLVGTDSTMYIALTLKQGYEYPHMTTLFEKRQLKAVPEDLYYTDMDLYNLIWEPLEKELSGVENVYFSPSGDLHRIGIEYVPVTMTDNMCDKYNIHRLSSTRQLAYIQDETKGDKSVLYGGLKYEVAVSDTIPAPPSSKVNRGFTFVPRAIVDSLDIRGSYKYLPGTKEEADRIASNLDSYSIPYKYYYGTGGTEESFKCLDGSKPKTLHIATHGFYMTEQDAEKKNFARPLLLEESQGCREDKPMTRSGLLLSGCSRALNHESIPEGVEDGILTADEISKLDMRGLDLVVLSACQTGLGDITSGEGVFGLQRGFKNAGAKTIIMSLWNVSDIATLHLMTSFYNHYLSGMPKEQAFRMAQAELRKLIDPGQSKPDWAAFVMLDGL